MNTQRIYTKNAQFQKFEVLKTNRNKRYKYGEFFVEGVRNINEAVKNHWQINSFLFSFEKKLSSWATDLIAQTETQVNFELPDALMRELSEKEDTSELLAVLRMRLDSDRFVSLGENPLLALFDRPSNKGNLGTILRSCDALGVEGLIITGHAVDLYDPETIAASMGSLFKVPSIRIADNENVVRLVGSLRETYPDLQVIGTSAHAEQAVFECNFTTPTLFILGNETDGISRYMQEMSDKMVNIPMAKDSSASSFNVACAASILFYEAVRQRSISGND